MEKIKKLYTITLILLGVVTVLLMILAEKSDNGAEKNTTFEESAQSENDSKKDESTNAESVEAWALYENKEAKFRLDYLDTWTVKEDKDEFGNIIVKFTSSETTEAIKKEVERMGQNYTLSESDIVVIYNPTVADEAVNRANGYGAKTLEELIENPNMDIERMGEIDLNGSKAIEAITSGEADVYSLYVEKEGHLYEIMFMNRMKKESLSETEKKILATFELE